MTRTPAGSAGRRQAPDPVVVGGRSAFTLLELLIAVAIVLLLAGIAVPPALSLVQEQRFVASADAFGRAALETRRAAIEAGHAMELVYVEPGDATIAPAPGAAPPALAAPGADTDPRRWPDITPTDTFDGGRLILRRFDPSGNTTDALAFSGAEGAPVPTDVFGPTDTAATREIVAFETTTEIAFPSGVEPDAEFDETDPEQPWWMMGAYDAGERPVLVVGSDGLPLWSRPVRVAVGRRDVTLGFHPVSGEPLEIAPPPEPAAGPPSARTGTPLSRDDAAAIPPSRGAR